MTVEEMMEVVSSSDAWCVDFDELPNKRSQRSDLHAFLLLDELVPESCRIVMSTGKDQIYLSISLSELAKVITKEQVIELLKCGVMFDDEGLYIFV